MEAGINYFDEFKNKYYFRGTLEARTGLHIGSGLGDDNTDARIIKMDNTPYIPGSTIKGIVRSNTERIVATLQEKDYFPFNTCLLEEDSQVDCVTEDRKLKEKLTEIRKNDESEYFGQLSDMLCSVCQIFGSTELASRVKFSDAFPVNDNNGIYIRDGIAIDRDTGTAREGAKYDYEVLGKGTRFDFEMVAENLTDDELGLIITGLNELIRDSAFMGGMKARGLGKVKLEIEEIEYINQDDLEKYLKNGGMNTVRNIDDFLEEKVENLFNGGN